MCCSWRAGCTCDELVQAVDQTGLVVGVDNFEGSGREEGLNAMGDGVWESRNSVKASSGPERSGNWGESLESRKKNQSERGIVSRGRNMSVAVLSISLLSFCSIGCKCCG